MRSVGVAVLILLAFFAYDAQAGGKTIGNGGDEIALEFQNAAAGALEDSRDLGLIKPEEFSALRYTALNATILVTENPLASFRDNTEQESIAVNVPASGTIIINRFRWEDINNPYLKAGIALHEVLSLRGIEKTGSYRISGAYLANYKLTFRDIEPLGKGEAEIVNCSDYTNSLFSVIGLRKNLQRTSITPISENARATLLAFARSLSVPFPENVTGVSVVIPEDDCDFDPRNRGIIKCNKDNKHKREGSLELLYKNGVTLLHPVDDLRFTVAAPLLGRVSPQRRVDSLELGITNGSLVSELSLKIRARTCR